MRRPEKLRPMRLAAHRPGEEKPPQPSAPDDTPTGRTVNSDAPWVVIVIGNRDRVWGRYATFAGATATARKLREHGFAVRIEGPRS
jgi:hypothetical protein